MAFLQDFTTSGSIQLEQLTLTAFSCILLCYWGECFAFHKRIIRSAQRS